MFEQTLPENTKEILTELSHSHIFNEAYLAGGTAAALQLGHRISRDLDFFTPKDFNENSLVQHLSTLGNFKLDRIDWKTVLGFFGGVKFSYFFYEYPLLRPSILYQETKIASLPDIAAMKINAIAGRGSRRDFVDLYFIIQSTVSLTESLNLYNQKYRNLAQNRIHIEKSLIYFEDADEEPMPEMLKQVDWEEIKKFFFKEVRNLAST